MGRTRGRKVNYKDDELHGLYKAYYDNGELYCEGHYFEGEEIGLWKFYHPNGNLKKTYYYSDGESIGHHIYYSISEKKRQIIFIKMKYCITQKYLIAKEKLCVTSKHRKEKGFTILQM